MSHPCPVPDCDLDATEWGICRSCAARLSRDLAAIPALAGEVDATIARQAAAGARVGPRGTETPLAFDPRASAALGALKAVLVGWVRDLAEGTAAVWPNDTVGDCAAWLAARVDLLRVHPAAGEIAEEIGIATDRCWRVIDRAPAAWFAGPCDACGAAMYARAGAALVRCPAAGCRIGYDVPGRRAHLIAAARDYLLTIPELRRALPDWIGAPVNDATLRQWRARGRLVPHGRTAAGADTFRIGDVLDLLAVGQ